MATAMTLSTCSHEFSQVISCLHSWLLLPSIWQKQKNCVVTRFISFPLGTQVDNIHHSWQLPGAHMTRFWLKNHGASIRIPPPASWVTSKNPYLLSFTPFPFHSDLILMLKIGPQSGRVQVLELTFGQEGIHWSDCRESWIFIGLFHWSLRVACQQRLVVIYDLL